jgi:hypothetical protein
MVSIGKSNGTLSYNALPTGECRFEASFGDDTIIRFYSVLLQGELIAEFKGIFVLHHDISYH